MAQKSGNKLAAFLFSIRSYTPVPFVILMLLFSSPTPVSYAVGLFMILLGEAFRYGGVCWAGSETRTTGTVGGAFLVISGPFAYVRNPLYVGNILIYTGFGVLTLALYPWLTVIAFAFFVFQYILIVGEEETYLQKTYKEDYKKYKNHVPRFIPQLKPYRNKSIKQPPFNPKAGLRSESRTLQAIGITLLLVTLKWIFDFKIL